MAKEMKYHHRPSDKATEQENFNTRGGFINE